MSDFVYSINSDPAASLTGKEVVPLMKGGNASETTTQDIAALASGGSGGALAWEAEPTSADATGLAVIANSAAFAGLAGEDGGVVTFAIAISGTASDTGECVVSTNLPLESTVDTPIVAVGSGVGSSPIIVAQTNSTSLDFTFSGTEDAAFAIWCTGQYTTTQRPS